MDTTIDMACLQIRGTTGSDHTAVKIEKDEEDDDNVDNMIKDIY